MNNNSVKIFTNSSQGEYTLSLSDTKQTVVLNNNKAKYYAELAEKYKNEAKEYRDNAQYYAEQNSDVTFEYINNIENRLLSQIETKQNIGDYATRGELPTKVSDLYNDSNYAISDDVISRDTEIIEQMGLELEQMNQDVNTKLDTKVKLDGSNAEFPHVVETYINGTSWYRKYSDGWLEQGGIISASNPTLSFIKAFKDTNYYFNWIFQDNTKAIQLDFKYQSVNNKTVNSVFICNGTSAVFTMMWEAKGYTT